MTIEFDTAVEKKMHIQIEITEDCEITEETVALLDRIAARDEVWTGPAFDEFRRRWDAEENSPLECYGDLETNQSLSVSDPSPLPNSPMGSLNEMQSDYLRKIGLSEEVIHGGMFHANSDGSFQISGLDGVPIRLTEFGYTVDQDLWSGVYSPRISSQTDTDCVVVVADPLQAISLEATGVNAIAVSLNHWCEWSGTDFQHANAMDVPYARLNSALFSALRGRNVVVSKAFGEGEKCLLGHAIKFHVPVKSLQIIDDSKGILKATSAKVELPRYYKSFPFDIGVETGQVLSFNYPLTYPANDLVLPKILKDAEIPSKESSKDSNTYIVRLPMEGVPLARIRRTLRDLEFTGDIAVLNGNGTGQAGEVEEMEGITSSRNILVWHQSAEEKAEQMIRRGFTAYDPRRSQDFRNVLAAQKSSRDHRIEYVTSKKGWIGLKQANGETIYPAAYIFEGKVVQLAEVPPIVAHQTSVRPTSTAGSVVEWCKIISPVMHNANLAAIFGFSVSGLFLPFLNGEGESGLMQMVGSSGSGKTSLQRVVASAFTAPSKPGRSASGIMSWRTTENGLEAPFVARNHAVALIDEIGAAGVNTDWSALAYMLGNGVAKSRLNADGSPRETRTWQTQTISSGEVSFGSLLSAKKSADRGGLYFRVIDLMVADAEFWSDIEVESNKPGGGRYRDICQQYGTGGHAPAQIIDAIVGGLQQHHGHIWMLIAQSLLNEEVRESVRKNYFSALKELTAQCDSTQGVVHRRSKHLAAAIAGLDLLQETMAQVIKIDESEEIQSKARSWLVKHLWRAGLPENFIDESSRIAERALEFIAMRPNRFVRPGEGRSFSPEYWGWLAGKQGQVFVTSSGISAISAELNEDPHRLQTALKKLPKDDAWAPDQIRPIGGGNPIRGILAPIGFKLISTEG